MVKGLISNLVKNYTNDHIWSFNEGECTTELYKIV